MQLTTPLSALGEFAVPLQLPKSLPLPEGKFHFLAETGSMNTCCIQNILIEDFKTLVFKFHFLCEMFDLALDEILRLQVSFSDTHTTLEE
ncbi:hypothetical protein Tco_1340323 [Tanacetum coccineum]